MKIKKLLKPYFQYYNDGQTINVQGNNIKADSSFFDEMYPGEVEVETIIIPPVNESSTTLHYKKYKLPSKFLNKFSPNNLNNKKFWKKLNKKGYKLKSVTGANVSNIYEANCVNKMLLNYYLKNINTSINNHDFNDGNKKFKVLEIGYGFGAFAGLIHDKFGGYLSNRYLDYYGIDIVKRIDDFNNLFETDGWKIPKEVPCDLDMVCSINVFQHLSKEQRTNYFKKSYKRLKNGGVMLFSSFIMTEDNKDSYVWGLIDENNRGYCQFFNQATPVDFDTELKDELNKIGFDIDEFYISAINHLDCVLTKRIRNITENDPYGEENE